MFLKGLAIIWIALVNLPYITLLSCQISVIVLWLGTFVVNKNTVKIKKIQEHALHFIYDDYKSTYEFLLDKSKLLSLKTCRIHTIALETFKIVNNKCPLFIQDLVKNNNYNFRYVNYEVPMTRITFGNKSFRYEAAQVWNSVPNEARTIASFYQFRTYINSWCGRSINAVVLHVDTNLCCLRSACLVLSPPLLFDFQNLHLSNKTSFLQLQLIERHLPHMVLNVVQVRFIILFACMYTV